MIVAASSLRVYVYVYVYGPHSGKAHRKKLALFSSGMVLVFRAVVGSQVPPEAFSVSYTLKLSSVRRHGVRIKAPIIMRRCRT